MNEEKRPRRELPSLLYESDESETEADKANALDALDDTSLKRFLVMQPDEAQRRVACNLNKRTWHLCRDSDVYAAVLLREFFPYEEDAEILRLHAALDASPPAMERGRLVGRLYALEDNALRTLQADKHAVAGDGVYSWRRYYMALRYLRDMWPDVLEIGLPTGWVLRDLEKHVREALLNGDLALFRVLVAPGDIRISPTRTVKSALFQAAALMTSDDDVTKPLLLARAVVEKAVSPYSYSKLGATSSVSGATRLAMIETAIQASDAIGANQFAFGPRQVIIGAHGRRGGSALLEDAYLIGNRKIFLEILRVSMSWRTPLEQSIAKRDFLNKFDKAEPWAREAVAKW